MTENKLQSLFNFLSVMSELCDTGGLLKQAPSYITSKFIQYLNDYDKFEFPEINISDEEYEFLVKYDIFWGGLSDDDKITKKMFENILIFVYRVGWDEGVLPSCQLKMFKKCIGDYNLIKEPYNKYDGIHKVIINDLFEKEIYNTSDEILKNDINKLHREFKIDNLLKTERWKIN